MYVRCHLEYAVQAWSPWTKQDIDNIENVQKRAIRMCYGLEGTYEDKLQMLGLTTLYDRKIRGNMLETYKILNNFEDVDDHTWFTEVNEQHQKTRLAVNVLEDGTVVGSKNLVKPKCKLDIRKYFFTCRIVDHWNNLPANVKGAVNVLDFKTKYDSQKVNL